MGIRKFFYVFLCLLFLSAITPTVSGRELSIEATADSYTESENPDVNNGGTNIIYSYNYEYELLGEIYVFEYHTWLKFDLSEIPSDATVNSIILRMHTSIIGTTTTNKVGVFLGSHSNWQETEITWDNCPPIIEQPIDTVYVASSDTNYEFDVTSAVKGKPVVTLVLKTLEPTDLLGWAAFDSRETHFDRDKPKLIVEFTTPSPEFGFPLLAMILIVIVVIAVSLLVVYFAVWKKKQPSTPTTPSTSPQTFFHP